LFVFRTRIQAIHARQIHQNHLAVIIHLGAADALLYRYAREVSHFLAQAGQPIEEC